MVYDMKTIGARAIEAAVIFQMNHAIPTPITEAASPGDSAECQLDQVRGDTHQVAVCDEGPCSLQQLYCFGLK
jgi:hypothetical protein